MNGLQDVSDGGKYIYYVMQYHPKLLVKASFLTYLCMKNKYAKIITEPITKNLKACTTISQVKDVVFKKVT